MAIVPFLAMTGAEIQNTSHFPERIGWLGCHFSSSGPGLSNLPQQLPSGSLIVLDDANPIAGHDPERITDQLLQTVGQLECSGILLDFQRREQQEAAAMAEAIVAALPCPVAVSSLYAADLDCPVFLPPVPVTVPLTQTLAPWQGRECWLELALDGEIITLTQEGASTATLADFPEHGFPEEKLHCHYALELSSDQARWSLWRTNQDLEALLEEAEALGATNAVGLWQELKNTI